MWFSFDFAFSHALVERILVAPYEERDTWDLNVMMIDDALYFEEHLTDAQLTEKSVTLCPSYPVRSSFLREATNPRLRKFMYNGQVYTDCSTFKND